ncbi:hypothetical protein FH972_025575 [Carpinus fangiana]|uniref:DUF726 domain-containing protein n=1 Tax=Carpinus fangiana TaxID=176857 RepID=A0A5N6L206_9ROSI|nr:hypothetical protein FH972_025575 [Carpinus fangiana]
MSAPPHYEQSAGSGMSGRTYGAQSRPPGLEDDDDGDLGGGITMTFGPESPVERDPSPDLPLPSKPTNNESKTTLHEPQSDNTEHSVQPSAQANPKVTSPNATPSSHSRQPSSQAPTSPSQERGVLARQRSDTTGNRLVSGASAPGVSEWSHQQHVTQEPVEDAKEEDEWQEMPSYAPFDLYDDDNKLIAREHVDSDEEEVSYQGFGGRGYTRVTVDEDAKSATSMDEDTAYLFKETTNALDDDEEARGTMEQMQATKELLSPNERIAYVGVVRLALADMLKDLAAIERTRGSKKEIDIAVESMKMLTQKLMIRLYSHMELEAAEQLMIEQLTEHGLQPSDLTPTLMRNSRVKNPMKDEAESKAAEPKVDSDSLDGKTSYDSTETDPDQDSTERKSSSDLTDSKKSHTNGSQTIEVDDQSSIDGEDVAPPPYQAVDDNTAPELLDSNNIPQTKDIDIDIRWTVLCDLFLVLVADGVYDSRSRYLLERVGSFLDVPWLEICRFEKRVTEALEMQEANQKEVWNEEEHIENRKKLARRKRLMYMGIATVGGGLVIGLSAGILAPMIGAGLAAGFTTIGISGTGTFLGGAGAAAIIGTGGTITGSAIGGRAANRRTGHVKTFEYRPLHHNKRVNLIVTIAGWMNGKIDDVRLPFSTVNPVMGDIFSVLWEPEMLTSMGDTINILATELPLVLSKLSYLIDNPWSVSMARADAAGLILADSLIDRNLGTRPITLVGFSLGSRVIISALRELAKKGAVGLIQNVYLFGSPVVVKKDEYLRARTVVSGRFVNGYATNDWILGYLFRATGGGIMRVAGLAAVEIPGIENFNVTEFVPGHMAYRKAMPRILREVGWAIESDEFSEIEDPDPENHQARQRQLIDEIEEARKDLEANPEKKRFGFFKRNKKGLVKKNWEMYDERSNRGPDGTEPVRVTDSNGGVIFDVDAIHREALELATQGIEIKQLESTLPPMKINAAQLEERGGVTPRPSPRMSKDYFAGSPTRSNTSTPGPSETTRPSMQASKSWSNDTRDETPVRQRSYTPEPEEKDVHMTFNTSFDSPEKNAHKGYIDLSREDRDKNRDNRSSTATQDSQQPLSGPGAGHNPWDDDDEFGEEKEIEMTFA